MSTDLHQQLADELGVSPSDAERVLQDLLRDVKDRTAAGEDVTLPGLGTFFSTEEGALQFAPEPHLQTAVNYQNALFAPMTVSTTREAAAEEDDAILVADAPPEEPTPPDASPLPDGKEDTFAPIDPSDAPADAVDDAADNAPEETATEETAAPPADADTPSHVATRPPVEALDEIAPLSEEWTRELDEEDASGPAAPSPGTSSSSSSDKPASTAQIVGLAASVAVLAGLLWFVLGAQGIVTGPGELFSASSSPAPTGEDSATTAVNDPPEEAPSPADSVEEARPSDSQATPPTIDRSAGGWTIVVASRERPQAAEAILESYQQRFQGNTVPVDILTGTASNGQVRYRITVGQYDVREEALTALRTLADQLPDDAWPIRIQPNS